MNYGPISPKIPGLLHGADYNPDQWLHDERVLSEDVRLMKLSRCSVMSVNIFGWAACEPEEGQYTFEWLDRTINTLYENGIYTILATPSGARPAWMSHRYPEVLRVGSDGRRNLHGGRHNHCPTSPVYREKVRAMNTQLAQRYGSHPGLILWHVSNEYGGECFCPLCQEAFRQFLRQRYGTLDKLNHAWWTGFWSHTYTDWQQVEAPMPRGETSVHGLNLDWKRFVTSQTLDFYLKECEPLRAIAPDIPVTTNFHDFINLNDGLDYWAFARHVDVISWDNYPYWHGERPPHVEAARRAFIHDINRSLKQGRPFMLMESAPSATNWQPVAKLRRPGMQELASIQAIAHGSDTVQYFQWRKSLGSSEKFHAAVVDHYPTEHTRVFREVQKLGEVLSRLSAVAGTSVQPEVAIYYDWENMWAMTDAQGPRRERREYFETAVSHYQAFWNRGIPADIIDSGCDIRRYRLVIAPMLYMVKPGVADRVRDFVKAGGCFVTTYWSGIVDESDLCFTTGRPGPLRDVMGIWSEEIDALYDHQSNRIEMAGALPGMKAAYKAEVFCDLVHLEGAKALTCYGEDFYAGRPALTRNHFGKGQAWYIAFRGYDGFLDDFYGALAGDLELRRALDAALPRGVTAQMRQDSDNRFIFLQNYGNEPAQVDLGSARYADAVHGGWHSGVVTLPAYGYLVLMVPVPGA